MKQVTRRQFMVDGSRLMGGTLGVLAMGSVALSPKAAMAANVDFLETSCGAKKNATKRILVTYASFCGSTGGVAEAIGQTLCRDGARVDVKRVDKSINLSTYDAVVIGSAAKSSSWRSEAIGFVENNQTQLGRIPVAYFLTCLALYNDNTNSREVARSYLDPVLNAAPKVKPVSIGLFAGALDYSKMNFVFRRVMKSMMKKKGVPEGDYRNWVGIRSWAATLPALL